MNKLNTTRLLIFFACTLFAFVVMLNAAERILFKTSAIKESEIATWQKYAGEWQVKNNGSLEGSPGSRIALPQSYSWDIALRATIHFLPSMAQGKIPLAPSGQTPPNACICFGEWMVIFRADSIFIGQWKNGQIIALAQNAFPAFSHNRDYRVDFNYSFGHCRLAMDNDVVIDTLLTMPAKQDFSIFLDVGGAPVVFKDISVSRIVPDPIIVDYNNKQIILGAAFKPWQWNREKGLKNHHFIVWEKGKAGWLGLFNTFASDTEIHDALVGIGATPGNSLSSAAWDKRNNPKAKEPQTLASGDNLEIYFIGNGVYYRPQDILSDKIMTPFEFKFTGNKALIPKWKSGCVICLQACPGGKIGHAHYSMRDLATGKTAFTIEEETAFNSGDTVSILIRPISK